MYSNEHKVVQKCVKIIKNYTCYLLIFLVYWEWRHVLSYITYLLSFLFFLTFIFTLRGTSSCERNLLKCHLNDDKRNFRHDGLLGAGPKRKLQDKEI